jgi:hypothetical protein
MTYQMDIETADGIKPHGFHLGTDLKIARQLAVEALKRTGVISVALRGDKNKLVEMFDWRDLEDETPYGDELCRNGIIIDDCTCC